MTEELRPSIRPELRVRIVNRIFQLSQFSYCHENWWTLMDLMGEPVWSEEDADRDSTIVELFELIENDEVAMTALRIGYNAMKRYNGEIK